MNSARNSIIVAFCLALLLISSGCARGQVAATSPSLKDMGPAPDLEDMGPAPDFELFNQDGALVRLSHFRGKVVLMNFFYTSCTGVCHLQNFDLKAIADSLDKDSRQQLVLISISFDPEIDTPAVLKKYAHDRGFNVAGWQFLTGTKEQIERVTRDYGIVYELVPAEEHVHPDGEAHKHERAFSHLSQSILIDQKGSIRGAHLGIQIGSQVFDRDTVLNQIRLLLGKAKA